MSKRSDAKAAQRQADARKADENRNAKAKAAEQRAKDAQKGREADEAIRNNPNRGHRW